jgi:hypothetical protein
VIAGGSGSPEDQYQGNAIPCYTGDNSLFGSAQESEVRSENWLVFNIVHSFAGRLRGQDSGISLYFSLLAGNLIQRTVRWRLHSPPNSLDIMDKR